LQLTQKKALILGIWLGILSSEEATSVVISVKEIYQSESCISIGDEVCIFVVAIVWPALVGEIVVAFIIGLVVGKLVGELVEIDVALVVGELVGELVGIDVGLVVGELVGGLSFSFDSRACEMIVFEKNTCNKRPIGIR